MLKTEYFTDFGKISNSQEINFTLEHNQWKTLWKWDYLWPGFDPKGKIEINEKLKTPIETKQAVYVIPRLMYDWGKYTTILSILTNIRDSQIDVILRESIPDDFPRFVGYINQEVDSDTVKRNLLPGISIKNENTIDSGTIIFVDSKGTKTTLIIEQE
jgi:hypothetical protein